MYQQENLCVFVVHTTNVVNLSSGKWMSTVDDENNGQTEQRKSIHPSFIHL